MLGEHDQVTLAKDWLTMMPHLLKSLRSAQNSGKGGLSDFLRVATVDGFRDVTGELARAVPGYPDWQCPVR